MAAVTCPLCGIRKARRGCPALKHQICTICCGTKRLTEIACPSDCTWLASAREHPPAAIVRQQQNDLSLLVQFMRDFSERQSRLFFLVQTFLNGYQAPELQALIDDDVADAVAALAATYETASRGVIYEHRPSSLAAERLVAALRPVLAEAGKGLGASFERDVAVVLRRVGEAVAAARTKDPSNRRAFLGIVSRVIRRPEGPSADGGDSVRTPEDPASRLIVP
jgi:hypothetical protein